MCGADFNEKVKPMNPVTLYVTYQGDQDAHFDRSYYAKKHLPLVKASFTRYGLLSLSVFYPEMSQSGTIAICECVFRDDMAISAAFDSPEASAVMKDVVQFTRIVPVRLRAIPL